MTYDFATLSPFDFQELARQLVSREIGVRLEGFAEGRDDGIDGRYVSEEGTIIFQAKHYFRSGLSALKTNLKKERHKIDKLRAQRYILATSTPLTPNNKKSLAEIIGSSLLGPGDIFGPSDLNDLLKKFPDIERSHPSLWGQSTTVLKEVVKEALIDTQGSSAEIDADTNERVRRLELMLHRLEANGSTRRAYDVGVEPSALIELARRFAADVQDVEQAFRELARAVDIAIEFQFEARRGGSTSAFVGEVLERMADLAAKGLYDEAEIVASTEFSRWEEAEIKRRNLSVAVGVKLLDAGIAQDLLRGEVKNAVAKIVKKASLRASGRDDVFAILGDYHEEYLTRGQSSSASIEIRLAIEIALELLALAKGPDQHAEAHLWIGSSQLFLGQRELGTLTLAEATKHLQIASRSFYKRSPGAWAATQTNLSNALRIFGERKADMRLVQKGADAARGALTLLNRDRFPDQWATAGLNLALCLKLLGEKRHHTHDLEEAVALLNTVVAVFTERRSPREWAMAQVNLGNALVRLNHLHSDNDLRNEAVTAYQAALRVLTPENHQQEWASAQNNLGNLLREIAVAEGDHAKLAESATAFRAALKVWTREDSPYQWARVQENLKLLAKAE